MLKSKTEERHASSFSHTNVRPHDCVETAPPLLCLATSASAHKQSARQVGSKAFPRCFNRSYENRYDNSTTGPPWWQGDRDKVAGKIPVLHYERGAAALECRVITVPRMRSALGQCRAALKEATESSSSEGERASEGAREGRSWMTLSFVAAPLCTPTLGEILSANPENPDACIRPSSMFPPRISSYQRCVSQS